MKKRCLNENHEAYRNYGGRGITICDRWMSSFENFLEDMGPRPKGYTLDRFPDKNGNYEPGNCRWATPKQQAANTRASHLLTIDGITKSVPEWSLESGVGSSRIRQRLIHGWSPKDAVFTVKISPEQRSRIASENSKVGHSKRLLLNRRAE